MKLFSTKTTNSSGVSNWIFLALAVFVVMIALLNEVNDCGSVQFCATVVFFLVFMGSVVMLMLLIISTQNRRVLSFFWQDITLQKLLWVPIGFILVLGIAYGSSFIDSEFANLIGIFFSGIVMLVAFFATNSALVPILIHGFYNSLVVIMRSGFGFDLQGITVPDIGINVALLQQFGDIVPQIFFQIVLVSASEEFFKIFTIVFVIMATRGTFGINGPMKWVGGIVAVLIWTVYHTITAI